MIKRVFQTFCCLAAAAALCAFASSSAAWARGELDFATMSSEVGVVHTDSVGLTTTPGGVNANINPAIAILGGDGGLAIVEKKGGFMFSQIGGGSANIGTTDLDKSRSLPLIYPRPAPTSTTLLGG